MQPTLCQILAWFMQPPPLNFGKFDGLFGLDSRTKTSEKTTQNGACITYYFIFLFASVGFTIDRVTTQHTLKCAENCSDAKVPYIWLSNFYQIFCNLDYNSENSVFFSEL